MPLFQVILSTVSGAAYELDIRAPDACTAAWTAGTKIGEQGGHTVVVHVHARRVSNGEDYRDAPVHDGPWHEGSGAAMTDKGNQKQEVTLRSPDGSQTVRASYPEEIAQYEKHGYERVESDKQR